MVCPHCTTLTIWYLCLKAAELRDFGNFWNFWLFCTPPGPSPGLATGQLSMKCHKCSKHHLKLPPLLLLLLCISTSQAISSFVNKATPRRMTSIKYFKDKKGIAAFSVTRYSKHGPPPLHNADNLTLSMYFNIPSNFHPIVNNAPKRHATSIRCLKDKKALLLFT